jgi:zinc transporter ZupT
MMPEDDTEDEAAVALRRQQLRSRAKQLWWKVRIVFRFNNWVRMEIQKPQKNRNRAILKIAQEEVIEIERAKALAMSLFLGLLIDGVPECMLMGFLAAEERLTLVLVISLIVANFPEAFSSASLLKRARMSNVSIIGLWTGLMLFVGTFSGLTCYLLLLAFPRYGPDAEVMPLGILVFTSFVEGLAGGAMITLISAVILPEAMEKADNDGPVYHRSGFCCACGFLLSVLLKVAFDEEH